MTKEEEREGTPWKRRGEWQWRNAKQMYGKITTLKNEIVGICVCSGFQFSLGLGGAGYESIKKR